MFKDETDFIEAVSFVFNQQGWLVSQGFSYRAEQEEYAIDVAKWLLQPKRIVSLLDGSTGIGKTLAYLIPTMLFQIWKQKPVILSTYTLALQSQILESDIPIAIAYLVDSQLPVPTIARRVGRRQFVSKERILKREEELFPLGNVTDEWKRFTDWFIQALENGYATFEEWHDYCGLDLPAGLTPIDLCILEGEVDHPGVKRMLGEVADADFIITSHTSLLVEARSGGKLFLRTPQVKDGQQSSNTSDQTVENASPIAFREFSAIVMDEADKAIDAAESFFNRKVQIKSIKKKIERISTRANVKKETIALLDEISAYFAKSDSKLRDAIILKSSHSKDQDLYLRETLPKLGKLLFMLCQNKFHKKDIEAAELLEIANYVEEFYQDLISEGRQNAIRSIGFSDKNRIPSLMTNMPSASAIYNFFPKRGISMMYTSATLSDGRGSECSFRYFRGEMSVPSNLIAFEKVYSPSSYGQVTIELPPENTPSAFDNNGEYRPEWLQFVSNQISRAAAGGKNVLVLCPSYPEVQRLSKIIPFPDRLIVHQEGQTILEVVREFKQKGGVLLTPAMWEGVSIRNDAGGQFFDQLVITRIPFSPPSDAEKDVFIHDFRSYTKPCDHKKAESYYFGRNILKAIRKAMQGFGRLIRSSDDVGTVWFCDHKMPHSDSPNYTKIYRWIVPERFQKEYDRATSSGKQISLDKAA